MDVTGEYTGNSYPERGEYRISLTVLGTGEDFGLVVEDASGAVVNSVILDASTAEAVKDMAGTNHGLGAYEDDWSLPVGMNRVLTWDVGDSVNSVVLNEGQIDEVAAWLRYATGEETYDGNPDEWEY